MLFLLPELIFSQNGLHGTVTDQSDGSRLPYASLYFTDLMKGAVTDSAGNYSIKDLPSGSFLLEARFIGYRTWVGKVQLNGDARLDIPLVPAAAEMHEVVITGTSASVERRLNPVPTLIMNLDDLRRGNSTNVVEALSHRPGINQITTGSGISKPVIRGLGYNRVIVLTDGIRQEAQQWGDEHGVEIDSYSVNRVEVIKGPGSILYGSDAMAGVINFLSVAPPEEGTMKMNVSTEYQTNNKLAGLSFDSRGNLHGYSWMFRETGKLAGNFTNAADGRVFNSGFKEFDGSGYVGVNRRWGFTQLQYSIYNQFVGLIDGNRDSLGHFLKPVVVNASVEEQPATGADLSGYSIAVPLQKLLHWKVASSSSILLGKSRVSVKLAFQQNRRSEIGDPLFPDIASLFLKLNSLTYDLKYFLPETRGWETSFGIGGMIQSNRDGGVEYLIPAYDLQDGGLFIYSRKSVGKLILSGGLRADYRSIHSFSLSTAGVEKFQAFSRSFSSFSGSLGASYNFNENLVLKFNLSRGFRAPNIAELASNGKHEGTYRYELGNRHLQPEHSLQADAGIDVDRRHVSFETDVFFNSIDHYIFTEKLKSSTGADSIVNPADPAPAYRFVQGNAYLYGGEITLDIHPHPYDWVHFENTLSYVRGIRPGVADSLRSLPMIPPLKLGSQLRIEFPRTPAWMANAYVSIGTEVFMKQSHAFTAYGTEKESPAYVLMNAGMGCDILGRHRSPFVKIIISGSNLLDVSYQDHLSRLQYAPQNPLTGKTGIFNMGRNIGFKLLFPFSRKLNK